VTPSRRAVLRCLPLALVALGASAYALVATTSPSRLDLALAWAGPSGAHPLGAGEAGVDLAALAAHATARVLLLAAAVALAGFVSGLPLGTAAGFARGAAERWTLRACDLVQAFPTFLLALAVLAAVRVPSRVHIFGVFALTAWAPFARLALVQARLLESAQFVEAARALGATRARVVLRHVMPNLVGPVAVQAGTAAAGAVLGETALGFVGLGPRDGVSLGALLEQGTVSMLRAPHVLLVGAVAIALVAGSLQLASEALREALGGRELD
jgi:peptide/nickel transport system permease protein